MSAAAQTPFQSVAGPQTPFHNRITLTNSEVIHAGYVPVTQNSGLAMSGTACRPVARLTVKAWIISRITLSGTLGYSGSWCFRRPGARPSDLRQARWPRTTQLP